MVTNKEEKLQVVSKLPEQAINRFEDVDGVKYRLETVEESLTKIRNDLEEIKKSLT